MTLRVVQSEEFHGGLRSSGSHPLHIAVQAFCECGWRGTSHRWGAGAGAAERAELSAHLAETGHLPFRDGDAEGCHVFGCGYFHELNDACPAPPDSPAGRLGRITNGSTLGHPERALDRLAAIEELRAWLGEQEKEAAIGARVARCTWSEMGAAIGATRQAAWNRWGQMIGRYEAAGVLEPDGADQGAVSGPAPG